MKHFAVVVVSSSIAIAALVGSLAQAGKPEGPELLKLSGDISPVHDPAIIKEKETWYVFSTGGLVRSSKDLHHWEISGRVFATPPAWWRADIPAFQGGYWAPDISFYDGTYRLYYAISTFGENNSTIGLATNKTLDPANKEYRWIDAGAVMRSHSGDDFNAIDPNFAVDGKGGEWLAFGSFWGGIKMVRIDPHTGKLSTADARLYSLASRTRLSEWPASATLLPKQAAAETKNAVEAPFIVQHKHYYYLFASFDLCCKGADSTYNVVVGRSRSIIGPYSDEEGTLMIQGGGTRITTGTMLWRGPGHEGLLLQREGPDLMVFHAYDAKTGEPFLQISTIAWSRGWPRVASLP